MDDTIRTETEIFCNPEYDQRSTSIRNTYIQDCRRLFFVSVRRIESEGDLAEVFVGSASLDILNKLGDLSL